jgi:branched-chain amino acid transport system substrate-binding protein
MNITRRGFVGAGLAATLAPRLARAQSDKTIRIGVITDMSGIYRDVSGPTTVACAQQAAAEFMEANPSIKVEILVADHQNKADVGLAIIRKWFDQDGVDVIENVGNSSIALGAKYLMEDKNKVALITTAGSSDLTGKSCSANLVHWSWDSWCLAHSTATSLVRTGGSKWFFVTADYAFGHAAEAMRQNSSRRPAARCLARCAIPSVRRRTSRRSCCRHSRAAPTSSPLQIPATS